MNNFCTCGKFIYCGNECPNNSRTVTSAHTTMNSETTPELEKLVQQAAMDILGSAVAWFLMVKAQHLMERLFLGLDMIKSKQPLDSNYKKMFGFILFDYSMHLGPASFLKCEEAAREIGVLSEMHEYAKDWVDYAASKQTL